MRQLIDHPSTSITGTTIARRLNAYRGPPGEIPERPSYIIRWGSYARTRYLPGVRTLNRATQLRHRSSRGTQLHILRNAGLSAPFATTFRDEIIAQHDAGDRLGVFSRDLSASDDAAPTRGIGLCYHPAASVTRDSLPVGNYLYTIAYPKAFQYRVHVVGTRYRIQRLEPTCIQSTYRSIWNDLTDPAPFRYITESRVHSIPAVGPISVAAVAALGMDFGAVDVIVTPSGEIVILEVNSAPGLVDREGGTNPTLDWWVAELDAMSGGSN